MRNSSRIYRGNSRLTAGGGSIVVNPDGSITITPDSGAATVTLASGQLLLPDSPITAPAFSATDNTDQGIRFSSASMFFVVGGEDQAVARNGFWRLRDDVSFGWSNGAPGNALDTILSRKSAGVVAVGGATTASASIALTNEAEGDIGAVTKKTSRQVVAMGTGSTAVSTSISIPSGAELVSVALNVDVAITNDGNDTWAAALSGGSTTEIAAAGQLAAQNTKAKKMLGREITSGVTEITFTPQAANFTGGSIEVVAWYEETTDLADA